MGESAGGHFKEVVGKAAFGGVHFEDFGKVAIATEEDGGSAVCCFEEVEEAGSFVGHVAPFFKAVTRGENLNGADDDPEFGGLFEFLGEPGPLLFAEHGGVWAGGFDVVLATLGVLCFLEWAAKVAGVEEDELDAFFIGSEDFGMVDAFGCAGRMVGGEVEDVLKNLLGFAALGILAAGVVEAVVVVIPGRKDGDDFREGGEIGLGEKFVVFRPEDLHVGGVAVDIVAHEEEEVGLLFGDDFEDALVGFRFVAGPTGNFGHWFGS